MGVRNIALAVRNSPLITRYFIQGWALILVYWLGFAAVYLAPEESKNAVWWPAAGVSVAIVLFTRSSPWRTALLILIVSTGSNLLGGRPLAIAVAFGIANSVEAWLVARIISANGRGLRLERMRDVSRLVFAAVLGSLVAASIAATGLTVLDNAQFWVVFWSIAGSHASAVLVMVPAVLVTAATFKAGSTVERVIQPVILVLVVLAVFWPGQNLPLAFLSVPILVWAALRLGLSFLAVELLTVAIIAATFTSFGAGPFLGPGYGPEIARGSLQIYLVIQAASVLYLAAARQEREWLSRALAAREQLLRGGLVGSQVGFVLLERRDRATIRAVEANAVAIRLLGWPQPVARAALDFSPAQRLADPFLEIADSIFAGEREEFNGDVVLHSGRRVEVFAARFADSDDEAAVTAQLIDVTDRREAERATEAALRDEQRSAERLRDLNRQKDDFVSLVSHELRTPVTSILGFAEELEETVTGEEKEHVRVILRNAARLADLVENLLELGIMTTPNALRHSVAIDLNRVVLECVEEQRNRAELRKVTVRTVLESDPPSVLSDSHELARIVTNLLSNAIKFSPDGGTVTLTTRVSGNSVELRVIDEGPGIPEEEIDRVFERFFRSSAETLRNVQGTGLGLSIVKSLVDRLDGEIRIERGEPAGTIATAVLPLALPAVANA